MPKRLLSIAAHERRGGRYRCGQPREALGCCGLVLDASRQLFPSEPGAQQGRGTTGLYEYNQRHCLCQQHGCDASLRREAIMIKKKIKKEKQMQGLE